jgi:hypothetical protein
VNTKVIASFIAFAVLLIVWIYLAESITAHPELSDLLIFVKGATVTAWTAAALFFETNSPLTVVDSTTTVATTVEPVKS